MFSTIGLLTALVCALVGAAIAAVLAYTSRQDNRWIEGERDEVYGGHKRGHCEYYMASQDDRVWAAKWAAILTAPTVFLVTKLIGYYWMPPLIGLFGGYLVYVIFTVVPALTAAACFTGEGRKIYRLIAAVVACFFVYTIGVEMFYGFGPNNAQKFAGLANIKIAPKNSTIPPSDPNHILKVDGAMAVAKGHAALGSLNSEYDVGSFTKQGVNGHRYWIAPLILKNFLDRNNLGNSESPGYVVVDAEDPEKDGEVKEGHHIRYFENGNWDLNLYRYLYTHGFADGILENPKFEVDDNWQPYWVVSHVKRPFGGVAGRKIENVIVVKLTENGAEVSTYNPENEAERKQHAWVDRVMNKDLVNEYVSDWGWYGGDFVKKGGWWSYLKVFFHADKKGTMRPGWIDLCYTTADENVWVIPMTSTSPSKNSKGETCMGLLVYETNRNEATFYPELANFNIHGAAMLEGAPGNLRHYPVVSTQLQSIDGELTWVGIFASQNGASTPSGIGFLHVHGQNALDAIFATNERTALAMYKTQLVARNSGNGHISKTADKGKELVGKVKRIAPLPTTSGSSTWLFIIEGEGHSFLITRDIYPNIPLVKEGDEITFTFMDTHEPEVPVGTFHCPVLDGDKPQEKEAQPQPVPPVPEKN